MNELVEGLIRAAAYVLLCRELRRPRFSRRIWRAAGEVATQEETYAVYARLLV